MKDFINRHGHLSMWVILILLVIAFFMSRNFLLWSTYQKTMDAFAEFPEQENNNIFITAQVDMVKIVTKTAEIDINDYPELYEMLCDAEFAGRYTFYNQGISLDGVEIYYLHFYSKDLKSPASFIISTNNEFNRLKYDNKSISINIDEKVVAYLHGLIDGIGEYQ